MRKIYLELRVKVIVRADDSVSVEDLENGIGVTCIADDPESRFEVEDYDCHSLTVEDSK